MSIIIKHTIEVSKFIINFDMQDGSLSFLSVELNTEGDIDLSTIINKLSEFIGLKKNLQIEFEDTGNLSESKPKIKLIKETLNEIYYKFNEQFIVRTDEAINVPEMPPGITQDDDDLPF